MRVSKRLSGSVAHPPGSSDFTWLLLFLSGTNYVATLTVGGAGAHASYYHKANDQVAFDFISALFTQTRALFFFFFFKLNE